MAERRMFAKSVITKTKFLMMPATARLLYYDLGVRADDDGVVEAYGVLRETGAREDDLKLLVAKGFIYVLDADEMIMLISDWNTNNQIRPDRYKPSQHHDLLVSMFPEAERKFKKKPELSERTEPEPDTDGNTVVYQVDTTGNHRLGKDSIGKDSIGKKKAPDGAVELWNCLCERGFCSPGMEREREVKQAIFDFCQMRQKKRKSINTAATVSRLASTLAKLAAGAVDEITTIVDSLNQSTENCWTGLFAPGVQQSSATPARIGQETPNINAGRRYRIT